MVWRNENIGQWLIHRRAVKWLIWGGFFAVLAGLLFAYLSFPIAYLFERGFSRTSLEGALKLIFRYIEKPSYIFSNYSRWFGAVFKGEVMKAHMFLPVFPPFITLVVFIFAFVSNPYEFGPLPYGNAKLAVKKDIDNMGLFKGFMIVLGAFKGRLLKLPDTMSVLCVAPPGTGKTVGVVIPTIFESDNICLFINDGKGEIAPLTSGYRSALGPVFMFNWGAVDNPQEGIFWPKWNPLSEGNIPPPCPGRENYIGGLAFFLIKDGPVGTDPYWIKMARMTLEGLIFYIVSKCEQAMANDYFLAKLFEGEIDDEDYKVLESYYLAMKCEQAKEALKNIKLKNITLENYLPIGSWEGISKGWQGREPSFPMLIDWMTEQQIRAGSHAKALAEGGDMQALGMDILREIIMVALEESVHFGYSRRAIIELNQLADVPKKQRGSILSTALAGLSLFKNSAVRERTASSDFYTNFMRGYKNQITDKWEPITVYISIPTGDAGFLSSLTSLFLEMNAGYFIIFKPSEGGAGPYPALYILDEFGVMPNMGSVIDGVCSGLSKKFSFLLIVQDFSQISGKYGAGALETIISNTAAKIIMQQNNEITAARLAGMSDYRTLYVRSRSATEFMGMNKSPFTFGTSYSPIYETILSASMLMNLSSKTQVVLYQRFIKAPMLLEQPRYYMNRDMLKKSQIMPSDKFPKYLKELRNEQDENPPQSSFDAIGDDSDRLISFGLFSREAVKGENKDKKKAEYEVINDEEFAGEWQDFEHEWQEFEEEWNEDYGNYHQDFQDYDQFYNNFMPEEVYDNYQPQSLDYEPAPHIDDNDAWWLQDQAFGLSKDNGYHYQKERYNNETNHSVDVASNHNLDFSQDELWSEEEFFEENLVSEDNYENIFAEQEEIFNDDFTEAPHLEDFFDDFEEADDLDDSFDEIKEDEK